MNLLRHHRQYVSINIYVYRYFTFHHFIGFDVEVPDSGRISGSELKVGLLVAGDEYTLQLRPCRHSTTMQKIKHHCIYYKKRNKHCTVPSVSSFVCIAAVLC